MYNYFYDFFLNFTGITNDITLTVLSEILVCFILLAGIYLLTCIVFPKKSMVKNVVFISLFLAAILVIMYSNGFTLITITQTLAQMGGV